MSQKYIPNMPTKVPKSIQIIDYYTGKLTSTFNHSADTFIQSDLNEDNSNQPNNM